MWLKAVERKGQSVLISSYFYNGIHAKYFNRTLQLNVGLNNYLILNYVNYYKKEDVEDFVRKMEPLLRNSHYALLRELFDKLYRKADELTEFSEYVSGRDTKTLGENGLDYFKRFSELCLEFGPAMYLPILVEKLIERKIRWIVDHHVKSDKNKAQYLFTSSHRPTDGSFEIMNLHKLAVMYHADEKSNAIGQQIEDHLQKFGWLSFTKFVGERWTPGLILERIRMLEDADLTKRLEDLKGRYVQNEKETRLTISQNKITKEDEKIIWLAKELAYFRTYRLDIYTKAGFRSKKLFAIIADKLAIAENDLVWLTYEEIIRYLASRKKVDRGIIKKRKTGIWQLTFTDGRMEFKYGEPFDVPRTEETEATEVKGRTAFSGCVTGKAKVIRGVLEFNKMEKGDVLVTSMTTPDFVPLMEKSKAIVTDEGGMTCHAAIVAREMQKPCVVGTRYATHVFKDGDMVEVDADHGIVRKVNTGG